MFSSILKLLVWGFLISGKEKISPGRVTDHNQVASDSESVIVAMERVSVLFDR